MVASLVETEWVGGRKLMRPCPFEAGYVIFTGDPSSVATRQREEASSNEQQEEGERSGLNLAQLRVKSLNALRRALSLATGGVNCVLEASETEKGRVSTGIQE